MGPEILLVQGGIDGNGFENERFPCEAISRGMQILLTTAVCAAYSDEPEWFFAIEIDQLRQAGLIDPWLRWLVVRGYLIHREETTFFGQTDRTFRDIGRLRFSSQSCFILTEAGRLFARQLTGGTLDVLNGRVSTPDAPPASTGGPVWDCQRKELRCDGRLVKRFRVQSPNQETILMAFEEESWPARIDDPLPQKHEQCPKRRLHDAIKNLNRRQQHRLLRFHGDGTGEGILWDRIAPAASERVPRTSR